MGSNNNLGYDEHLMSRADDAAEGQPGSAVLFPSSTVEAVNELQTEPNVIDSGKKIGNLELVNVLKSSNYVPKRRGFMLNGSTGATDFCDVRIGNDTIRIWSAGLRVKNGNGIFLAPADSQTRPVYYKKGINFSEDSTEIFVSYSYTGANCTTTAGSNIITVPSSVTSDANFRVGMSVSGPSIPADNWVTKRVSSTQLEIAYAPTVTDVGLTLTFIPDTTGFSEPNAFDAVRVGDVVSCNGIPQGAQVISVDSTTKFTIDKDTIYSATNQTAYFTPPEFVNSDYMRIFTDSSTVTLTNCTTAIGSSTLAVSSTSLLYVGMGVENRAYPKGTYILDILGPTSVRLSNVGTVGSTTATVIFSAGIGIINLPKSDQLWINATGDGYGDGNLIMKILGPKQIGAQNTGIVDLWAGLNLLSTSSTKVETSGFYNSPGMIYHNSSMHRVRVYDGATNEWQSLPYESGTSSGLTRVNVYVKDNTLTSHDIVVPHTLGVTPRSVDIATYCGGQESQGHWDGTYNNCIYKYTMAGTWYSYVSTDYAAWTAQSGTDYVTAHVSAADEDEVTISLVKNGSPTGQTHYLVTLHA